MTNAMTVPLPMQAVGNLSQLVRAANEAPTCRPTRNVHWPYACRKTTTSTPPVSWSARTCATSSTSRAATPAMACPWPT